MNLLALDLGRNVGVAIGDVGSPTLETLELPQSIGPMMELFEGFLRMHIRRGIDVIAYEQPLMQFGRAQANLNKHYHTQFGQASHILRLAHGDDVLVMPYRVGDVRFKHCGMRGAKPPDIMAACHKRDLAPSNDHEADAALIWFSCFEKSVKVQKVL